MEPITISVLPESHLSNVAYSRLSVSEDDRKSQPARNTLAMLKEKVTPESLL